VHIGGDEVGLTQARSHEPGLRFLHRLAMWAILACAFTVCQVQYSSRHGRLLVPPTYDDVAYFNDGLQRLETAYQGGLVALVREYVTRPPHSPFSSLLALVAFAVFGVVEWGPYAANVLVVFVALALLDALTGPMPTAGRIASAATLLSVPITGMAVVDFRPDIACGVLTAGAVTAVLLPPEGDRARCTLWAGALFGLALLVKPAIFVVTVPVAILSFTLTAISARWEPAPDSVRRELAAGVVAGCAIAAPHFILTLPHYVSYFREAIFSPGKPIAAMPGTVADQLTFYLWGQGGNFAFGSQLPLLAALFIMGTVVLVRARRAPSWRRLAAAGLVMVAAFAIPTVSPVKQPFLGAQFAYLVVLLALVVFARGAMVLGERLGLAALVAAALVAAASFSWPDTFPRTPPQDVAARNALPRQVYQEVISHLEGNEARVYMTTTGYFGPELLVYLALKDRRPGITARSEMLSDDLNTHLQQMDKADFVLANEPGVAETSPYLPSSRVQAETLALVRHRPDYAEIARFPSSSGRAYFLFQRVGAFFGWRAGPGWLPLEGPYPQWKLSYVRWGCHPSATIHLNGAGGPPDVIVFSARTDSPDQTMTLSIAGRPFHVHHFSAPGRFEEVRVPWPENTPPSPVEFTFTSRSPMDSAQRRAVLFNALQVLPVGARPGEPGSAVRRSP